MRNISNTFRFMAIVVLAMTMVAGCALEKEEIPSVEAKKDVMVLLNIAAAQMQTKAIDDQTIKTVRIYAFDDSGTLLGHVYTEEISDIHMTLSVPEAQNTLPVEFYVIGNERAMYYDNSHISLSETTTIDNLKAIYYNSLYISENAIPMYGLHSQVININSGAQHTEGNHTGFLLNDSVNILLQRSLAKIGIYAAAMEGTVNNPVISKITFLSQGRRNDSYLFPAADRASLVERDADIQSLPNDRVFDMTDDGVDMLANNGIVTKRLAASNLDPDAVVTDYYTEVMSPIYVAELPHGSNAWNVMSDQTLRPAVFMIEYSSGEGTVVKKVDINMPEIQRNAFYQVRCLIKADGQLLVDVKVLPWDEGEDHELNFDFPTHTDPLLATSSLQLDGTYTPHVYGTPATMYYYDADPERGAFSVDFNMSYPIGGQWNPSIYGASESDYTIKVYKRGSTTPESDNLIVVTDAPLVEQWYTIKVIPTSADNVGNKFNLAVTYTPIYSGTAYSYLLQINGGEENNLAWSDYSPDESDGFDPSTVNIVITQIEEQTGF